MEWEYRTGFVEEKIYTEIERVESQFMKKIILLAIALIVFQKWDSIQLFLNPPPDYSRFQKEKVVLYATDWCGYCKKTRKLLADNGITYYEYDIEKSDEGKSQYKSLGGNGVPLLLIDGEIVQGFNAKKILSLAK